MFLEQAIDYIEDKKAEMEKAGFIPSIELLLELIKKEIEIRDETLSLTSDKN